MREIKLTDITREELWAKQRLSFTDIDYAVWERNKSMLHQFSKMNRNCTFVVDVYKCRYAYASPNFVDLLGYDAHKIATLERQGDYLESRIHPDDREQLLTLQIKLSQFIYSLPPEQQMTILIFTVFVFSMRGNNTCVLQQASGSGADHRWKSMAGNREYGYLT